MSTDNLDTENSFLGRGWKFPPSFTEDSYTVEMVQDEVDIKESIIIILNTIIGERVMRPDFGANLEDMLFEKINITTLNMIVNRMKRAFMNHESRIEVHDIDMTPNASEGMIQITVKYSIRSTNTRTNLVYPFYVSEATDI